MLEYLIQGFMTVCSFSNIGFLISGVFLGVIMGAIPGLTSVMAIALIIPLTFTLDPVRSLIMMLGAYNGGIFGGSISATLLSTPGTPASAATVIDAFKLAKQGKGKKTIKMALIASVMGCIFSTIVLILIAEPIARFALKFGPAEYTLIIVFSLTIIGSVAGKSMVKGLIGGVLGLLFSVVGSDPISSTPRLTFNLNPVLGGINLVVMLIGLLAVSQIFLQIEQNIGTKGIKVNAHHLPPPICRDDERVTFKEFKSYLKTIFRSSVIGCFIGSLPALGPTLASYLGYDMAKRFSKHPETFGEGEMEGVVAAEAANNAVCGANLIPLLALGVPGDLMAAILVGAFLIQGLTPGPMIFREAPQVVYGLYVGLFVSNVVLFIIVSMLLNFFIRLAQLSVVIIYPAVLVFCMVGVYAINQNIGDIWVMLFFAVIGYLMLKFEFSPATMLIGFILGPLFEVNFRRTLLLSNGSIKVFFGSPILIVIWVITFISMFITIRGRLTRKSFK